MGELISIFSRLRYPKVCSKLMVFSLLLWVKPDMKIKVDGENTEHTQLYLYGAGDESGTMVEHLKNFKKRDIASEFVNDKTKINLSINKEGKHNKTYWSDEFPKGFE
jgi:predicted alpha/beta superfamily hydrolase